jgi:hypothetical protein
MICDHMAFTAISMSPSHKILTLLCKSSICNLHWTSKLIHLHPIQAPLLENFCEASSDFLMDSKKILKLPEISLTTKLQVLPLPSLC